ncbi:MAG: PAS domain S-box protein [Opitutae bacterium]|nr:PAS domain S-box protein [Opitutae bacterium]
MTLLLIISILLRFAAAVWSLLLLRRLRDWRMGILTVMLVFMTYRQCGTLLAQPQWWPPTTAGIEEEWAGLAVSVLALLMVGFLAQLLTERQQTEARISESEARYRRAEAGTTDGLWEWNIATGEEYCSPRWLEILGYLPGDSLKTFAAFTMLIHPDDRARAMAESEQSQRDHRPFAVEMRLRRKDGSYLPVLSRGQIELDAGGKPARMTGAITDISARQQAEAALRVSVSRHRRLVESNIIGVMIANTDGRITEANDLFLGMVGHSREDLSAGRVRWDALTPPEWKAADLRALGELKSTGACTPYEKEYFHKDGRRVPILIAVAMLEGTPGDGICLIEDLTARKQAEAALRGSEARFRTLTESTSAAVFIYQGELFCYVNPAAEALTGYPAAALQRMTFWDLVHPEFREAVRARGRRRDRGENLPDRYEVKILTRTGEERWVDYTAGATEYQGRPAGIGTAFDITARKQAEAIGACQAKVLEMIATGAPLAETLGTLLLLIEAFAPSMLGSILLLDADGVHVRHGAAPSLPEAFNRAIEGRPIGPRAGSCGTAAFRREPVIVEDIATDPLWAEYKEAALPHGLRACWSTPIFGAQGEVLGTFAIYYRQPGGPTALHRRCIELATGLAAIAISRQRAEAALRETQRQLTSLIGNLPGVVYRCRNDANWTTEFISEGALQLFGYAAADFMEHRREIGQLIHPDDQGRVWEEIQAALRERRRYELVYRIITASGAEKWLEEQGVGVFAAGGALQALEGFAIDITARRRSEEAETERNKLAQQVSMIATTAPGALASFRLRPDGRAGFPYASPAWLSLFAVTQAEVAEDTGPLLKRLHPDDVAHFLATIQESARSLADWRDEFRVLHPDRGELWVAGHSTPVRESDGSILWHGFITDITERKRRDEALRAQHRELENLYATTPVGLALMDRGLRFVRINGQLAAINGKPVEAHLGRTIEEALPGLAPVLTPIYRRVLDGNTPVLNVEIHGETPAEPGVMRDWLANYYPLLAADGSVSGISIAVMEITAQKRAEAALREKEQLLSESQRIAHIGGWYWDLAGPIRWTDETYRVYGVAPETFTLNAESFFNLIHPEDRPAMQRWVAACAAGERPGELEFRALPPDGSVRVLSGRGELISAAGIKPAVMAGTVQDITARKLTEEALRESEARLRLSAEAANVGLWDWDLKTNRVFFSREWKNQIGYREEEIANDFREWQGRVHPDDLEPTQQKVRAYLAHPQGRYESEFRFRHKDGCYRWIYTHADVVRDAAGRPVRMLGCHIDITARKEAEEALRESEAKFRTLAETTAASIFVLQGPRFKFANPALERLTGYAREELLAMNFWDTAHPDHRELVHARGLARQRGEPVPIRYEFKLLSKQGETRWVDFTAGLINYEGQPASLGTALDITERKQGEQALQESQAQLRALLARLQRAREEERKRVSREIHDELGQLLTGLKMDMRWLERKLSDPALPPALNPLLDRAVGASQLADQTIATVQRIAEELRPGVLDQIGLGAAIAQELRRFEQRGDVRGTVVLAEPAPALPAAVANELFYICREALTNVARHAQAAHVRIALRREEGSTVLEVSDDGVGIADADLNAPRSLGLLGMQERAAQCGGTVAFARNEPRGTRVTVRVPLVGAH